MLTLTNKPWRKFAANKQKPVIKRWLKTVAGETKQTFRDGMLGPHTGTVRRKASGKGLHTASVNHALSEYPANDSGKLLSSARTMQRADSVQFGTNEFYARFLRNGTGMMKRRRMSDTALRTGATIARPTSKGWLAWQKAKRK